MTDDERSIAGGHIDGERGKLWLQIAYMTHTQVREWPEWSGLTEEIR